MGRKRKNVDPLRPMPTGLYLHKDGRYRSPVTGGGYHYFGKDYETATHDYRVWRGDTPTEARGTVGALLDWYIALIAPTRVKPRTVADYRRYINRCLKPVLGHLNVNELTSAHLAQYRDKRAIHAPSQVMKEFAPLSQAYKFAIENGTAKYNPVPDVVAPRKAPPRTRYISNEEFLLVYNADSTPDVIKKAMTLAWRTLQEPGDLVHMGPAMVTIREGQRVIDTTRRKTAVGALVIVEGDLARLIDEHPSHIKHFIHGNRYAGKPYTSHGLAGMFYKACQAVGIADFGLKDIRAKGATDMDIAGVDRRIIQRLLNHKSLATTEIYLKKHNPAPVRMNLKVMAA
jgi:integrase